MNFRAMVVAAAVSTKAMAFDVESRFDSGLEGWTLEGPGSLEWISTPGTGGHLKVTRTGMGELYLVAPPSFHGDWRGRRPRFTLNYKQPAISAMRGTSIEVSGPGGLVIMGSGHTGIYANTWTATAGWMSSQQGLVIQNVTSVRVRIGTDPTLPIGEVAYVDSMSVQSCPANCDGSSASPMLTANDFMCFMNGVPNRDPRCNFDGQNGLAFGEEFQAFLDSYAGGC
jgi:hypothetical protein